MTPTATMESVWRLFGEGWNMVLIARRLGIKESEAVDMLATMRALRAPTPDDPPVRADTESRAMGLSGRLVRLLKIYRRPLTDLELAAMTGRRAEHIRDALERLEQRGEVARSADCPRAFSPARDG